MKGAEPAKPVELARTSDRLTFLYVEHARIDRDLNAVTVQQISGTAHIPVATLAALLLGPGTRITHSAVTLLAGDGCSTLWVGEEGVRLYAGAVSVSTSSALLQRQAELVSDPSTRLGVARAMYAMRFPGEDVSQVPMQALRGREGARVRACYREHSQRTGVSWIRRQYIQGKWSAADPVNRALSAANSALYGVIHAAILHLGCSPGLGFVHTGHRLSFVYDIADLYKATTSIPVAFDTAAAGQHDLSSRARRAMRDQLTRAGILGHSVADIKALLGMQGQGAEEAGPAVPPSLWDGQGTVPGGVSYAEES